MFIDESQIHPLLREPYPLQALPKPRSLLVRMDITNKCNLDCVQCTLASNRAALGESTSDMPLELFERIADQPLCAACGVRRPLAQPLRHDHRRLPGDVGVIPGNVEHEAWFVEDTEVIDVFAPPREDFFPGAGAPAYMQQG